MIVVCPSCNRRYRHEFEEGSVATVARCSGCDERFPLAPPKRTYVVADTGVPSVLPRFPVDRDLPPTALASDAPPMAADDLAISIEPAPVPQAGVDSSPVPAPATEPGPAAEAEPEVPAERPTPAPSRRRALVESLVALVPCGAGSTVAYHLAGPAGQDPITWGALGGAVGLLVGWACLLWITRRD